MPHTSTTYNRAGLARLVQKYDADKSANLARIVATCERIAEWGSIPRQTEQELVYLSKAYSTACRMSDLCGRALAKCSGASISDDCVQSLV